MERITSCFVLLYFCLNVECLLFIGQANVTPTSSGQQNINLDNQLRQLERVLDSVVTEVLSLKQKNQQQQTRISALENELQNVQRESSLLRSDLEICNSSTTYLLEQNAILKKKVNSLNTLCMLIQQNMVTPANMKSLEDVLTFEMEQNIRDSEQKLMMNISGTIQDLHLRDRYMSQSLLDVHNSTAALKSSMEVQQKLAKLAIQNSTFTLHNEITKVNDSLSKLRNAHIGSNVAFTAGADTQKYSNGQTVIFGRMIYEVGGGYNPTTGVFTSPKAGLYIIFCTVVADDLRSFWTQIMINGAVKAGVMAYNHSPQNLYQSASNLIVQHLQAGDRVWIQLHYGDLLYSNKPDSTFSAILING